MKIHEIVESYNVPGTGGGTGGAGNATKTVAAPKPQHRQQQQRAPQANVNNKPMKASKLTTADGDEIDLSNDDVSIELNADGTVNVHAE